MQYFIFHKPFRVLCQFSPEGDKTTLSNFGFPKNVYPLGRLDYDSEGLLIITDDKRLNHLLLDPKFAHRKTYHAQLEGILNEEEIKNFENGPDINVKGRMHKSKVASIKAIDIQMEDRNPPIRFRKNIPSPWYEIEITEGKNRQIRKMTAAVNHPTLRLIRVAIEDIKIGNLQAGQNIELSAKSIYEKLHIPYS
jgi:23S rRNA pseudouridine2457 synthase